MEISVDCLKELREKTGAGIMECRQCLLEAEGDMAKAAQILKKRSLIKAEKKRGRAALQGLIEAYIHKPGRIGALVEINCETDFAAQTDQFKELAHNLAMQVAAQDPRYISPEEIPAGTEVEPEIACLLLQPYIRDLSMTVQDIINDTIARVGENIKVRRFARFALNEE